MNTLPKRSGAEFQRGLNLASAGVSPQQKPGRIRGNPSKQRGVVLFFALIALVVMSLAAVALIRSVDTSTIIAGNLAFRQSTVSSGDAGINAASAWLAATQTIMDNNGREAFKDAGCPAACDTAFNVDRGVAAGVLIINGAPGACCLNNGYHSSSSLSLTDGAGILWNDNDSVLVGNDFNGNRIRYVIQRMCRNANAWPSTGNCLFSDPSRLPDGNDTPDIANYCDANSVGCPSPGQAMLYRITSRIEGSRNTVSYVQSFVF